MDDFPCREFKYLCREKTEEGAILLLLYNMTRGLKPNIIIEIGTGTSHTTSAFLEGLDEVGKEAMLYTIDPEPHIAQGLLGHPYLYSYVGKSDEAFAIWDKNKVIDILYIDGNHHYDQVKRDFDQWTQCLAYNGYVLIHDTNNHWWMDIPKVLGEIRATNQWDIITVPYGYGMAILQRKVQ